LWHCSPRGEMWCFVTINGLLHFSKAMCSHWTEIRGEAVGHWFR
jgi:hypothetical protein